MSKNIEFLKKRKEGIGGSDVSSILGYKSFKTAVEIWKDKINPNVEEMVLRPDDHTANMYWGKALEEKIRDAYRLVEGNEVTYKKENGDNLDQFKHAKYPWLIANVDGIAHTKEHGNIILELKCCSFDSNEEWGESGTDVIPDKYMLQVQHYMNVLNMPMAHVALLKLGFDFRIYKIPRSNCIIDGMHENLERFWFENVKNKIAPEPSNLKDVRILHKKSNALEKEATEEQIKSAYEIRMLNKDISDIKKQVERKKTEIANYMGECGSLVSFNGASNEIIATFNSNKNGTRVFRVSK